MSIEPTGPEAPLGSQGASDFSSFVGGGQPGGKPAPAAPAPGPATSSNGGGRRGPVLIIDPPATGSKPLSESTGVEPPETQPDAQVPPQMPGTPSVVPPGTQPQSVVPPGQDHASIVSAAVEATLRAQRAEQDAAAYRTRQEQPLTDAEFNAKYRVVQVTPQTMTEIFNQDPVKAAGAMNNLISSAVTQALLMAADITKAEVASVRNEFNPHITSWQNHQKEIREKAAFDQFYTTYPELRDEQAMVSAVKNDYIARMKSGQIKFKDPQEAFAAVANTTKTLLQKYGWAAPNGGQPNGAAASGGGHQTVPPQTRQMSGLSSPGRPGTGQAPTRTVVEDIFGADAR